MQVQFAPQLYIPHGITDLSFYEKALGATEVMRFSNDDGSVHVAEFILGETVFHVHEETTHSGRISPARLSGTSVVIGLFVADVDMVMQSAQEAGAIIISPATSYDYGYRQGDFRDPFGHIWMIESRI